MRIIGFTLGLMLGWITAASGLEIEEQRLFPGSGARVLRIASTTDLVVFEPYIRAFQALRPEISVDYSVVSSSDLHRALRDGAMFDLAISSAMDLQFQLANDGFAQAYRSVATEALPDWARWRDLIFAFTTEPAVVVINPNAFEGLELPRTRQELIVILRDNPDRFQGAVGTYDVRDSGLGFLLATQDDRASDAYWRLSEVMGRLGPKLYCCSSQMVRDVAEGRLAVAYNVLDSYATARSDESGAARVEVLQLQDFGNVMLRTVLIPVTAVETEAAGAMIDMLARLGLREEPGNWPLPSLNQGGTGATMGFGPIRLGPGLMAYLDPLNRKAFLTEWENALEQR